MNRRPFLLLTLIVLGIQPSVTYAQTLEPNEQEAPESIFQFDVADAEVELFLSGEWQARSEFGYTWYLPLAGQPADVTRRPIPGLATPTPLANDVNLTLSLWLLQRYFFEAQVSDQIDSSTILLGYFGAPGELVQSVLIGTTSIGMGAYPYLGFGDSVGSIGQEGPGASLFLQTDFSEHEAMVRFSPGSTQRLVWSGGVIRSSNNIPISEFTRDRYFLLPDGGVTGLRVFSEDPNGPLTGSDGRLYRELSLADAAGFSLTDGTVRFREPLERKTLVYYEVSGTPIGDGTLGGSSYFGIGTDRVPDESLPRDFSFAPADIDEILAFLSSDPAADGADPDPALSASDVQVSVDGVDTLVLYHPGRLSPFERLNAYELPVEGASFRLESASGTPVDNSLQFVQDPTQQVVLVRSDSGNPRSFENRYPFAGTFLAEPQPEIYPPGRGRIDGHQIVVEQRTSSENLVLPPNTVAGSVRVTRNGTPELRFSLQDSGVVNFTRPLSQQDVVEVVFRVSEGDATDALIGFGNTFRPIDGLSLQAALGARWNASAGAHSTQPGENSGYIVLSGGAEVTNGSLLGDWVTGSAAAAISFAMSDTTGALRIESMDGGGLTLSQNAYRMFPAAPPVVDPDAGDGLNAGAADRGILRYRDLYVEDAFGNRELLSYEFRTDRSVSPIEDGAMSGPYPARVREDDYTGTAMVLEYEIPAGATWAGGQLELPSAADLSSAAQLRIPYLFSDVTGTAEVYLQLGYLAEDLDADGDLDSGQDALQFNDARTGFTFAAGTPQPPQLTYSEDRNQNGLLDSGLPERVVTIGPLTLTTDSWETLTIALSEDQRVLLAGTRAAAFYVLRDTADSLPRSGTLITGDISVEGEPVFVTTPGAPTAADARVYGRPDSDSRLATPLEGAFDELDAAILRNEQAGNHLVADWSGLSSGSVVLHRSTNVPVADYGELRVYLLNDSLPASPTASVRVIGDEGVIAERSITLDQSGWHELSVALPQNVYATVTGVELEFQDEPAAVVLVDEISFWNPRSAVAIAGRVDLTVTPPLEIAVGDLLVLSDVQIKQQVTAQSGRVPTEDQSGAGITSRTDLSAQIVNGAVAVAGEFGYRNNQTGYAFEHSLERPWEELLLVRDSFRSADGSLENSWAHEGLLRVTPTPTLALNALWSQTNDSSQNREWSLAISEAQAFELPVVAQIEASVTESSDAIQSQSYGSRWLTGFSGLTGIASPSTRTISAGGQLGATIDNISIRPEIVLTGATSTESLLATSGLTTTLSIPWSLGAGRQVTVGLSRSAQMAFPGSPAVTATQEYERVLTTVFEHPLPFSSVPAYELFSPEFQQQFAIASRGSTTATYTPEISLAFRGPPLTSAASLIVPASASLSFRRTAEREQDSVRSFYSGELQSSFISLNLFGRMGVVPVFDFYESDEFQTRISMSIVEVPGTGWQHELSANQQTRLFLGGDRQLSAVTSLSVVVLEEPELSVDSTVQYDWISHLRGATDRSDSLIPARMQLEHRELLALSFDGGFAGLTTVRIRHESRLLVDEKSSVSLFLGAAAGRILSPFDTLVIGAELGISGTLRY